MSSVENLQLSVKKFAPSDFFLLLGTVYKLTFLKLQLSAARTVTTEDAAV